MIGSTSHLNCRGLNMIPLTSKKTIVKNWTRRRSRGGSWRKMPRSNSNNKGSLTCSMTTSLSSIPMSINTVTKQTLRQGLLHHVSSKFRPMSAYSRKMTDDLCLQFLSINILSLGSRLYYVVILYMSFTVFARHIFNIKKSNTKIWQTQIKLHKNNITMHKK